MSLRELTERDRGIMNAIKASDAAWFHGTNWEYLQLQMKTHGRYQHDQPEYGHMVNLAPDFKYSRNAALDSGKLWRKNPAVLMVHGAEAKKRVFLHPVTNQFVVEYLLPEEFVYCRLSPRNL